MGAKTAISIEPYLETSFPDLDREYVDGELVERAFPDDPHSTTQALLSPDDRMSEVQTKLDEYRAWGVTHVWLVDPHTERMYSCDEGFAQVSTLRVPELNLELKPSDIFERE